MRDNWKLSEENSEYYAGETDLPLVKSNLQQLFNLCDDVVFKDIIIGGHIAATVIFTDGLCNTEMINEDILRPLSDNYDYLSSCDANGVLDFIRHGGVYHTRQLNVTKTAEVIELVLNGFAAVIFDETQTGVCFEVKNYSKRSVSESNSENVQKGAKDSFIEVIRSNTCLVRLKITSHRLKIKEMTVGDTSKTRVAVVYFDGIADERVLSSVIDCVTSIKSKDLLTAAQFEEAVSADRFALFPQSIYTERPDKFCANIMEGKIGVLIDGLPTAYILPSVFNMFMQAPEDYAYSYVFGSAVRCLRYVCTAVSLILPALYIALVNFHQNMIPSKLAASIAEAKSGVPFPSVLEILFMLLAIEILMEAGKRLPQSIGQTISIVGGLIIGDAAVNAKLLSPAVVVVVAAAGICEFVIPNQDLSNALRVCRVLLVLSATVGGLFGMAFCLMLIVFHLNTLESFGVPYFAPFSGNGGKSLLQDTFFRMPFRRKEER